LLALIQTTFMRSVVSLAAVLVLLAPVAPARAGLYFSGEALAELPSQWRGFLLDQRSLRNIAVKSVAGGSANTLRPRYQDTARKLEAASRNRPLSAEESADLGALYIRLGETDRAINVLRLAQGRHADHFRIAANLGTAWQVHGDLAQAATALQQAVRLAPGKLERAEQLQLKLVRLRQRQGSAKEALDDLFDIHYISARASYEPGRVAAAERKKLPADAVALTQQLALWLPADGRLLWQLAELAGALGDVRTSAAIMDGCVNEFGMHNPDLRRHRQAARAAAGDLAAAPLLPADKLKIAHQEHAGGLRARSKRPLLVKADQDALPEIQIDGVTWVPWSVFGETILDRKFHPGFPRYLQELNGKQVALNGFMQPLAEDRDLGSFMLIENPVGCWYCEMPDMTGILLVQLPAGQTADFTRGPIKVTGTLKLNASDPENFLYTITLAKVVAETGG
jgi:hypothetical protein